MNTRIPEERRSEDQRRLLHELLEHEDVKELASSISKLGLFPNERLIVMGSGRSYIVLEGNRRLAAIKLLLNPELAPTDAQVKYFRKLSAKVNLASLGKLDVAVVSSRLAAAPIIAALHTGESKKKWSPLQQAVFYRELLDEGQTPAEIAETVGVGLGQVKGYLRAEKLYRLGAQLDYEASVRAVVDDTRRFPFTTLDRFLESKVARKFLGLELDDDHGFRGIVHPDRFKAVLHKVVSDVATIRGLTRQVNDEKGFQTYIEKAEKALPKTKVRGSFVPADLLGGADPGEPPRVQPPKKPVRVRRTKQSSSVVPTGFACTSKHDRVRAVFEELKGLSITDQRNSTGVMLRVLLDIALYSYLRENGHLPDAIDFADKDGKQRRRKPHWTPALRELISFSVEKHVLPGVTAEGYKAIRSLAAKDASYFITIDGFNDFTHNPYVTPTEGDLRALWQRAEPMLEVILG